MAYINFNYAFNDLIHYSGFAQDTLGSDQYSKSGDSADSMQSEPLSNQESKKAQSQSSFFERLVTSLPGMAFRCIFDDDFSMTYVSPGSFLLTGFQPEDLQNNRTLAYASLIHPDDYRVVRDEIQEASSTTRRFDLVYRLQPVSGETKWVRSIGRVFQPSEQNLPVMEGITIDVSDQKKAQADLQLQLLRQDALRKIDEAIMTSLDLQATLEVVLTQVVTHLGVEAADVFLFNPNAKSLEFAAGHGFRTAAVHHARVRQGEGLAGDAVRTRRRILRSGPLSVEDNGADPIPLAEEGYNFYLAEPLIVKGQMRGVMELFDGNVSERDAGWDEFLSALANQAAIAVDNAVLFDELQRANIELSLAYDSALESWSKVLEQRDKETDGHTQRVTELTLRLARAFKIDTRRLVHIRRGAILHDIGKMKISERIILKPEPLTPDEWAVIRTHPMLTYELLSPIPYLRPALTIPYCHHERWDGSGYPRGLRGEQIPIEARLFAVADVWDSLTSDRPYRRAWSRKKALKYIREQSGRHFDPAVVETFFSVVSDAN